MRTVLCFVAVLVGCARPPARGSAKDAAGSAVLGGEEQLAVELAPAADLAAEMRALDDFQPERFRFNSVEGKDDGVALALLAPGEKRDDALARLRKDPRVHLAEPVVQVHADFVPNDPQYPMQWNLRAIHVERAWDTTRGKGVVVAVVDTGIAYEDRGAFRQVPDLAGARFAPGYDFVHDTEHPDDDNGHGTHVAGTIAQVTDNHEGVAGIAGEATLMPIKVLDADGTGNSADIADAIHWAADHGARVINLSLGGSAPSRIMADAVAYAHRKGAVVVCAAGNGAQNQVEYPAAYPEAIAVSAVRYDGQLAPYSSWGKEIDLAAPGGDKTVDQNGDGQPDGILQNTIDPADPSRSTYAWFQGTSMAAPHVAGAAALLFAAGAKSAEQVEQALFDGAESRGTAWNERTGHGLLDVAASLEALEKPNGRRAGAMATRAAPGLRLAMVHILLGVLFAIALLSTLRRHDRPSLKPALVAALALAAAIMPLWTGRIFGGGLASPLVFSALIPLALSALGYGWKASRQVVAGLCLGFAAFLAYALWSGAPPIAWMPFRFIAVPWLLFNVLLCLLFARALMRRTAHQGGP